MSIAMATTLAAPSIVGAESFWDRLRYDPNDVPDRLNLSVGFLHTFNAESQIRLDDEVTGIGTTIDWADTLGGETTDNSIRANAKFRFNPRHSVGFTFFGVDRKGLTQTGDRLEIGDIDIGINADVTSKLNIDVWRFFYNWSFYRSDAIEVAFSPGVGLVDFEYKVFGDVVVEIDGVPVAPDVSAVEEEDLIAPLPSVGLQINYHMFPSYFGKRLLLRVRGDFFWVEVKNYSGSLAEFQGAVEYRVLKHLGLGVALGRQVVDVEKQTSNGWRVDNSWNQVYLYGAVYPF